MQCARELAGTIRRAENFIESHRSEDGLWRDFHTLAGSSSEWVTGFIAYALKQADPFNEAVVTPLSVLVRRQRPNGGWSYNKIVPTDCDSTAWILLALSTIPQWKPSVVRRGSRYLHLHQSESLGGFSTYSTHDGINAFIEARDPSLVEGWLHMHPCVTAVAIQALLISQESTGSESILRALRYLSQERKESGVWRSYWWNGYAYSTYHALKALHWGDALTAQERREVAQHLLTLQRPDGSWSNRENLQQSGIAFETAFVILALLLSPGPEVLKAAEKAVKWLIACQNEDGSWPTAPILRIPPPRVKNPNDLKKWHLNREGTGVIIEDGLRLFTSAAVLWALAVYSKVAFDTHAD